MMMRKRVCAPRVLFLVLLFIVGWARRDGASTAKNVCVLASRLKSLLLLTVSLSRSSPVWSRRETKREREAKLFFNSLPLARGEQKRRKQKRRRKERRRERSERSEKGKRRDEKREAPRRQRSSEQKVVPDPVEGRQALLRWLRLPAAATSTTTATTSKGRW